jgi:hypothetical protein
VFAFCRSYRSRIDSQTLRRGFFEEQLEVPVSLSGGRRTARKEVLFIRDERGFNVTGGMVFPSSELSYIARLAPSPANLDIRCAASPIRVAPGARI